MDSYPNFNIKGIPQGLESSGKAVNFLVENSTSYVSYPEFDLAMYFQTPNLQSEALRNAISQINQGFFTDWSWSENAAYPNASRITDLELVLKNDYQESNLQTTVWNSVAAVG